MYQISWNDFFSFLRTCEKLLTQNPYLLSCWSIFHGTHRNQSQLFERSKASQRLFPPTPKPGKSALGTRLKASDENFLFWVMTQPKRTYGKFKRQKRNHWRSHASSFFFRASVGCLWPLAGSTRSCPSISENSFEWNRHQLAEVKVNMAAISDAKGRLHC